MHVDPVFEMNEENKNLVEKKMKKTNSIPLAIKD